MATRYVCDVCGADALNRNGVDGATDSLVPEIDFHGMKVTIYAKKQSNDPANYKKRDEWFGDLCAECLIKAIQTKIPPPFPNAEALARTSEKEGK